MSWETQNWIPAVDGGLSLFCSISPWEDKNDCVMFFCTFMHHVPE